MDSNKLKAIDLALEKLCGQLSNCQLCPRNCRVDRRQKAGLPVGKAGFCGAKAEVVVYTNFLHQGEEPGISVKSGSGTIFFSGCSLKCIYCQNFQFSHTLDGQMVNTQQLADMMLSLQKQNAANINLVTPTHYLPRILEALKLAIGGGLDIPIVYNSSGYELTEIIKLLFGIVDVYLPDLKYIDSALAKNCSNAADYPEFANSAIKEMYGQQPQIIWDDDRLIAGTVIRHMVLPDNLENSRQVLTWIKENLDDVLVSVMFQYQPYFRAKEYQPINRKINQDEYNQIKQLVEELEINGWVQEFIPNESLAGVHFKKESNPPHE